MEIIRFVNHCPEEMRDAVNFCRAKLGVVTFGQEGQECDVMSDKPGLSTCNWSLWNAIYVYQEVSRAKNRPLRDTDKIYY
jgi:hypothetical protein